MAKQHANIAAQMRSELEEPLAAFAGGMKERRKIVQNGVEKLLKLKIQQTQQVNKTRDRYEQECLKIKGYLAQGHMVMGQEERKNKAKLEKTQISLAASNSEYEAAVKALEETTARWQTQWKAAADKFQDLEEERLDFTKSSLWTFANISSTVCVSDDASCEKIRLSLEKLDVERDIATFIKERGTGQEIPEAPKYINFCRGDVSDTHSEASEDENYSVAQFPRNINPAYKTGTVSPQPSTLESHHDTTSSLVREFGHEPATPPSREQTLTPSNAPLAPLAPLAPPAPPADNNKRPQQRQPPPAGYQPPEQSRPQYDSSSFAAVPHDPYPLDGMTMLCRTAGTPSDRSALSARPSSRDSQSDYSNPTSFSSQEPPSGKTSPVKQAPGFSPSDDKKVVKKKSGFFPSPFRRKSTREMAPAPSNRNTWGPTSTTGTQQAAGGQLTPTKRPQAYQSSDPYAAPSPYNLLGDGSGAGSPDPTDPTTNPNTSLALNVGQNVFPVTSPEKKKPAPAAEEDDPIALALAELKNTSIGSGKQSAGRISADHYHGISTPAPGAQPPTRAPMAVDARAGLMGTTPPPSYEHQMVAAAPVQRLGVPSPAVTSRTMMETSAKYQDQKRSMFGGSVGSGDRPGSGSYGNSNHGHSRSMSRPAIRGASNDIPRAASPAPLRSVSPRPGGGPSGSYDPRKDHRSASPNPYSGSQRYNNGNSPSTGTVKRGSDQGYYGRHNSPSTMNGSMRAASPNPYANRPGSRAGGGADMAVQLAPVPSDDGYGSQRGRHGRPGTSSGNNSQAMGLYEGPGPVASVSGTMRQRSKSVADPNRQYTRDGRPILHYGEFPCMTTPQL